MKIVGSQRRLTDCDFLEAEIGNERYRPITEGFDPSLPWSNSEFVACAKSGRIDLSEGV
ncbi:MAG: hypothetical protein MUO26_15475 [Methanotrichaceae archaeon]|nr:hypothetical protein [Methanotrichaceae archaeon]